MSYQEDIANSAIQNPYREFTLTIAAGVRAEPIYYNFSYFRVLSLTGTGLAVNFSGSGQDTSVIGGGIGIKLPQAVNYVGLVNTSGASLTVTIGLSMGEIFDDRLNVSGSVTVTNTVTTPLFVVSTGSTLSDIADVSAAALSTTQVVIAAGPSRRRTFVSNPVGSGANLRWGTTTAGAARGAYLYPGQTLDLELTGSLYVYNPTAAAVNVAVTFLGI